MRILLIDIDSRIPNLALHKIAKYHRDQGDEIIWNFPLEKWHVDKIYVSCIFTKNKRLCDEWVDIADIGGSGFDIKRKLSSEIEDIKPRINLGFTTRGCIRHCSFCIVPDKEGAIRVVGDLLDLWDGVSKEVTILDNNITALPDQLEKVCLQAQKHKIKIDFNQGLDHRLLTEDIVRILKATPHKEYRFAFDHPSYKPTVERAVTLLQNQGINKCTWYVLVGYNTTFEQDLERLNYLKSRGQNVYVQRYDTCHKKKEYIRLAQWGNQHHIFQGMTFEQFEIRKNAE